MRYLRSSMIIDELSMKTEPWSHQAEAYEQSARRIAFGLFMEQRTGKTRVILETAINMYNQGKITGVLIVAPAGVHRNWLTEEFPTHIDGNYTKHLWRSDKAKLVGVTEDREDLLTVKHLAVLAVNIEALRTDLCFRYCSKFLTTRRSIMVIDESQVIAAPGAKQTKRVRALGPKAIYRRILTGTPVTESPFQLYSQFAFLDKDVLGFQTFTSFKNRYGEWSQGYNFNTGQNYPVLENYRNLGELTTKIKDVSFRVRRSECADLPPKIYQKIFFDLTATQRSVYNELKDEQRLELHDGRQISVAMVLTRWLRLQQISSNFWPASTEVEPHEICDGEGCEDCSWLGVLEVSRPLTLIDPNRNPRLDATAELILSEPGQIVVWARFHQDLTQLATWCESNSVTWRRYDGTVNSEDRAESLTMFKEGSTKILLANPAAGGRGINLSVASMLIYYTNGFSLEQRLQSEDRAETLDRTISTQVIDLVANDTIDPIIIQAHRDKRSLAKLIAGDPTEDWI